MQKELCDNPAFIADGTSRFDLDQGNLGDCWFIAAAATLACRPELLDVVVPKDQSFQDNYAGIFHFNFWWHGNWREVIVDDRLPTILTQDGRRELAFCRNRTDNSEFWPALLEKAYAKLYRSYEALEAGFICDALVDFTGGIGDRMLLQRNRPPPDLFQQLLQHDKMNTLMGCVIKKSVGGMNEERLSNGLFTAHAYGITKVLEMSLGGAVQQLLRLQNPWGHSEWNGAWNDRSDEWNNIDEKTKQEIGVVNEEDGEFWMCYSDWVKIFDKLYFCYLPTTNQLSGRRKWFQIAFSGAWIPGVYSGCRGPDSSACQYRVKLEPHGPPKDECTAGADKDQEDKDQKCTVIVSLMQKTLTKQQPEMTFDLYKEISTQLDSAKTGTQCALEKMFIGQHVGYREYTKRFSLDPGRYVIIPSTKDERANGDYLLRVLADGLVGKDDDKEMDTPTEVIKQEEKHKAVSLYDVYNRYAGSDGVIDHRELQLVLNELLSEELGKDQRFDPETCRSLLSMFDLNESGVMEFDELRTLWGRLLMWANIFRQFEKERSGFIEVHKLFSIFQSVGYALNPTVLKTIVRRYAGKEGRLGFNDFVLAATKVTTILELFPKLATGAQRDIAELTADKLLQVVMHT